MCVSGDDRLFFVFAHLGMPLRRVGTELIRKAAVQTVMSVQYIEPNRGNIEVDGPMNFAYGRLT